MEFIDSILNALEERLRKHQVDAYAQREAGKSSEALSSISKAVEDQEIMIMVLQLQKAVLAAAIKEKIAAFVEEGEA